MKEQNRLKKYEEGKELTKVGVIGKEGRLVHDPTANCETLSSFFLSGKKKIIKDCHFCLAKD